MAAKDYTRNRATAKRLLEKFGAETTFVKESDAGEYDRQGNEVEASVEKTCTGYGVIDKFNVTEIDGDRIKSGDIKFIFYMEFAQGETFADGIEKGMKSTINGRTAEVVNPGPVLPRHGETPICYEIQLRF